MKKILVVTEVFYPENFLINDLVDQWQKDGVHVDVLTQHPSYPAGKIFDGYENKYYLKEHWGSSVIHRFKLVEGYKDSKIKKILNYWAFVKIGSKIAKQIGVNYDHIFIHQTGPLTLAFPALAIKKKYGIPVTIWSFDIWPDAVYAYGFPKIGLLDLFLKKIITNVYSHCDNILVSSKMFAETINQYVPGRKIDYVPNWLIKESFVSSELRLPTDMFNFTFTGNISIAQNLECVVRAFGKANLPNAVLNIIGNGSKFDAVKTIIENENIRNVVLHGSYPYNQMADILQQSDMLVLPLMANSGIEKTEPFKLQSYLMAKKPILGIVRGSVREIIIEEGLGICADPLDSENIALNFRAAMSFAKNNGEAVAFAASKLIETRYNRVKIIEKINEVIGLTRLNTKICL